MLRKSDKSRRIELPLSSADLDAAARSKARRGALADPLLPLFE
jgi:hypothetical protein